MNKKEIYWISQFTGWFAFSLVNIVIIASFNKMTLIKIPMFILLSLLGIFFTHIYRYIIIKQKWSSLSIYKLIIRSFIACILIATVIFFLLMPFELLIGDFKISQFNVGVLLVNVFNFSMVLLIWSLMYFTVHFFENKQVVQIESLIWEAAVKDFELKTLKSQLNPHFMFNALNSIRALVDEDPQKAQTAITQLSNILRYSLRIERIETVPLEDEIKTITDYLALESIRFEERLESKIEIDPKLAKTEIPPLMVQTLVENGIKHGISKRTIGGVILINAFPKDDNVIIQIRNSGRYDEQSLKDATGFGVQNTKQRLSLLYGENASFKLKNEENEIVLAELIIPNGGTIR